MPVPADSVGSTYASLVAGMSVTLDDVVLHGPLAALHLAASEGHTDVVECLIKNGADVNVTDRMGFSPLVDACRHGHLRIQNMLREAGGQVLGMDEAVVIEGEKERDGAASSKAVKPRPVSAPRGRSAATKLLNGNAPGPGPQISSGHPPAGARMFQQTPRFATAAPPFMTPPAAFHHNTAPLFATSRLF